MKRIYHKTKEHFLELETELKRDEGILLKNAKYFFAFCAFLIVAIVFYYSQTGEEFLPLILLSATAIIFWTHSDKAGKILMVAAATIGYSHEVIGGMEGWFAYTSGVLFQTPLWLIPGYAAIFWACYNLWKQGRKKYTIKEKNFKILAVSLIILMFVLDATIFNFRPTYWAFDIAVIAVVILLFRIPAHRQLAVITWFLVVLEELLGYLLGAWQHYLYSGQVSTLAGTVDISAPAATGFSFVGLIPTYFLFLWGALRLMDYVERKEVPLKREFALIGIALAIKAYTWFASSTIFIVFFP